MDMHVMNSMLDLKLCAICLCLHHFEYQKGNKNSTAAKNSEELKLKSGILIHLSN